MSNHGNELLIYAELDVFLDMRLAVLREMDSKADSLFLSWFRSRTNDNFGRVDTKISQEGYKERYANRDTELFQYAEMTPLAEDLVRIVLNKSGMLGLPIPTQKMQLDINVYPYDFDDESAERLLAILAHYISPIVEMSIVSLPPASLTPQFIKSKYEHVFMYNFEEWLAIHIPDLQTGILLPAVTFYPPKLHLSEKTTEEIKEAQSYLPTMSFFDFFPQIMVAVFQISYVEVSLYSIAET